MTEEELFQKAWLFLYKAAGENIGFEIKPKDHADPEPYQEKQSA